LYTNAGWIFVRFFLSTLQLVDMSKQEIKKKVWSKPAVRALSIKKDTFGGIPGGAEGGGGKTLPS
jgi:hypothetical protein